MDRIVFKYQEIQNFFLVSFELPKGPISPDDLRGIAHRAPKATPKLGVVLSGRGPIWLYVCLAHIYHPSSWVAIFDPRLGSGIVVATHVPSVKVGDTVPLEGIL
jgi:CRISPR-associated protein Csx3